MSSGDIILVIVVGTAVLFDFTNGFHDTANVVATAISTRAIGPGRAVAMASVLNFVGAFISLKVASTIGKGFVDSGAVNGKGLVDKLIVPAIVAPLIAFVVAGLSILIAYRIIGRLRPGAVGRGFRLGQIVSSGLLALSHGTNDAQKTMGVITLALIANGNIPATGFNVPDWVVVVSASAIALGTFTGGWRIIKTVGTRIISMDPAQGFAAQTAGSVV